MVCLLHHRMNHVSLTLMQMDRESNDLPHSLATHFLLYSPEGWLIFPCNSRVDFSQIYFSLLHIFNLRKAIEIIQYYLQWVCLQVIWFI